MSEPRRLGRPRKIPSDAPTHEDILRAAGDLFAQKGFAGTSTREIALRARVQQPTLFHHFSSKEAILEALSERAVATQLYELREIASSRVEPPVALYAAIHFHVRTLCSQSIDLTAILQDAFAMDRAKFGAWFAAVDEYTHGIRRIVEKGIHRGHFVSCDAGIATMSILGMCNWTIRWHRPAGRLSADAIATEMSQFALRSLLKRRNTLPTIERAALALDADR